MTIEALRKSLQSPYGIQSLNTHDIERATQEFDELKEKMADIIHYPDCWDTIAYPSLLDAVNNTDCYYLGCTECDWKTKVNAIREFAKWCQAEADSMADIHGKQAFAHAYKCHAAGLAIEFACRLEKCNELD